MLHLVNDVPVSQTLNLETRAPVARAEMDWHNAVFTRLAYSEIQFARHV